MTRFRVVIYFLLSTLLCAQVGPPPLTVPTFQFYTPLYCTGGTVTTPGSNRIHTFTTSGTLVCVGYGSASYLIVAGGGGGGLSGGGGGAGGLLTSSTFLSEGSTSVTIGPGGAASSSGTASSFGAVATATGGGAGECKQCRFGRRQRRRWRRQHWRRPSRRVRDWRSRKYWWAWRRQRRNC